MVDRSLHEARRLLADAVAQHAVGETPAAAAAGGEEQAAGEGPLQAATELFAEGWCLIHYRVLRQLPKGCDDMCRSGAPRSQRRQPRQQQLQRRPRQWQLKAAAAEAAAAEGSGSGLSVPALMSLSFLFGLFSRRL